MRHLLRFVTALALTGPVFFSLSRISPLARWVGSEAVWSALSPLFRLSGAVGTEDEETVLLGLLLMLSFIVSAAIVWGAGSLLARMRTHGVVPH
jgi:hypothetical protein